MNALDVIVLAGLIRGQWCLACDLSHGMAVTNRALRAAVEHRYLTGAVLAAA